jgi:hypothetical protein
MPRRPAISAETAVEGAAECVGGRRYSQTALRVQAAAQLLQTGARFTEARDQLAATFAVSTRQAERYIKAAYQDVLEAQETAERPHLKARASHRLWTIALKAERDGDYSAAVSALGRFAKLHGLDAPKEVAVTGTMTLEQEAMLGALRLTPLERDARIAELKQMADALLAGEERPRLQPPAVSGVEPSPAAVAQVPLPVPGRQPPPVPGRNRTGDEIADDHLAYLRKLEKETTR